MSELRTEWRRLFEPLDIAILVYFRIGFGILMLWEVLRFFNYDAVFGSIANNWIEPTFLFSYYGFDWIQPWPGDGTFTDDTRLLGDPTANPGIIQRAGFQPVFFDYDNDEDADIHVCNDFDVEIGPNVLWRNDGQGPTEEVCDRLDNDCDGFVDEDSNLCAIGELCIAGMCEIILG